MTERIRALGPNPLKQQNGKKPTAPKIEPSTEEDLFRGRKQKRT
jgi:hypothetical protein